MSAAERSAVQPDPQQWPDVVVLFDWNGTVVVDPDRARLALNAVLEARDLPQLDERAFGARFQLPLAVMLVGLGVAHGDVPNAEREWNAAMTSAPAVARAGARELFDQLRAGGARIGIVSAASAQAVGADLDRLGFARLFDSVDAGISDKPRTLRVHRPVRERAYFVGDTVYDVRSALMAGFTPIGVRGGYTDPDELTAAGAVALVDDLRELVGCIQLRRR